MTETIAKNDFIELRFTGRIRGGDIFDTNIPDEAKKIGLEINNKPVVICVSHGMILPKIDDFLVGKDMGQDYKLDVSPKEGFGERRREFLKVLPMDVFRKQNMMPQAGMVMSFDGMPARISAVSGGRVTVDFNNPLAGKDLVYDLKASRKVDSINEKIKSLILFFFRKDVKFELKEKEKKIILEIDDKFKLFLEVFAPKFREILGMELVIEEAKERAKVKEEKTDIKEGEKKEAKEEKAGKK
ncbi:peptidylprolyl isomerase [Candidatus Pacearchaeota archaeon]|nr:peptidylprolyl isomerase [Candidatus Pacearchaeota archaeon]